MGLHKSNPMETETVKTEQYPGGEEYVPSNRRRIYFPKLENQEINKRKVILKNCH